MAKIKTSNKSKILSTPVKLTGVEFYFEKFAASHRNPANKIVQIVFIPLLVFGIFAVAWCIQFPYIKFLGRYNADFNWASILLAVLGYTYIRLSPVLGYFMLFILLIIFYAITELAQWQKYGGPQLWMMGDVIFFVSSIALFIGYKQEGKQLSFEYRYKNLFIAPVFVLHLVLRRFKVKY